METCLRRTFVVTFCYQELSLADQAVINQAESAAQKRIAKLTIQCDLVRF